MMKFFLISTAAAAMIGAAFAEHVERDGSVMAEKSVSDNAIDEIMKAYSQDALDLAKQLGYELDFSEESLKILEEILEKYHQGIPRGLKKIFSKGPSEEEIDQVCKIWGAYLGEVIIKHLGGSWKESAVFAGALAVYLNNDGAETYPVARVYRRITDGDGDNVWVYYYALKQHGNELPR